MSYQDNVQAAAMALAHGEDANWELARLTFENTYEHNKRNVAGRVTMDQWCADVRAASGRKFAERHGARYKAIWARYGQALDLALGHPSWTDAMADIEPSAGAEPMRERATDRHLLEATPERKREIFQRLVQDEDVINRETAPEAVAMLHSRHRDVLHMPPVPSPNAEQVEAREQDRSTGTAAALGVAELGMCVSQMLSAAAKYRDTLRNMGQLSDMVRDAELQAVTYGIERWQENVELLTGASTIDAIDAFLKGNRA